MTITEGINRLPHSFIEGLNEAELLLPDGSHGIALAQTTNGLAKHMEPARTAWEKAGVSNEIIDQLIRADSTGFGEVTPIHLAAIEQILSDPNGNRVIEALTKLFEPYYAPVQPFLDTNGFNPQYGFNNHMLHFHIVTMAKRALILAEHEDILQRNKLLLAIFLHDQGNSLSRSMHALSLRFSIPAIFGSEEVLTCSSLGPAFLAAIAHDEKTGVLPIFQGIFKGMNIQSDTDLRPDTIQNIERQLIETMGRTWLHLLLLDKTHLDRERVINTRKISKEALSADQHFLANVGYGLDKFNFNGSEFDAGYGFSVVESELEIHPHIEAYAPRDAKPGKKLQVPEDMRDIFVTTNVSYFEQITKLATSLYRDRWLIAAVSAFMIYGDTMKSFKVTFKNKSPKNGMKDTISFSLTREMAWTEILKSTNIFTNATGAVMNITDHA
jgi:hypothetical protein